MCSCEDGNPPRVFERRLRKARPLRLPYECCECGYEILHGDWFEESRGLWEGGWDSFRTCLKCAARRKAWAAIECHPVFTQLRETITECLVTRNTYHDLAGQRRIRRVVDRDVGRMYLVALRAARAALRAEIELLERNRADRYADAGRRRELAKRVASHLGEGI